MAAATTTRRVGLCLVIVTGLVGCGGSSSVTSDGSIAVHFGSGGGGGKSAADASVGSGGGGAGGAGAAKGTGGGGTIDAAIDSAVVETGGSGVAGSTATGGAPQGTGGGAAGAGAGTTGSGGAGTGGKAGSGSGGAATGGASTGGASTGGSGTGGTGVAGAAGGTSGAAGTGGTGSACTTAATCPAPAGGNGNAVCAGNMCGIACSTGYHRCGNQCLVNTSVNSCGTGPNSCTPCPNPPGGAATCSGMPLACGVLCTSGYHECNGACVVNGSTSLMSCGNTCMPCTAPANGNATCDGMACVPSCKAGFHLCGNTCVADGSVAAGCTANGCRACVPPPNGTPACSASMCTVTCAAGFHACGTGPTARCVADGSVAAGCTANGCTACGDPNNGGASCTGNTCNVTCDPGFHACGGNSCLPNNDINSCGTLCTPCDVRPNATASCTAGACAYKCNAGFHLCGGVCVSNTASATCGTMDGVDCTGCGPGSACGANAMCGAVCGPGTHTCLGMNGCFPDDSTTACGATAGVCQTCAPSSDPNAVPVCANNACGFECKPNFHRCPAGTGPCVSDNSPLTCGASCMACPTPTTAVAMPIAGFGVGVCAITPPATRQACGVLCAQPDYHLCGTLAAPRCELKTDPNNCGMMCQKCPTPANSKAVCTAGTCDFTCADTFHKCGAGPNVTCESDMDAMHCGTGAACKVCPGGTGADGGAAGLCVGNVCK